MGATLSFDAGSYRDREGRVFYGSVDEVYRALSVRAFAEWEAVRATRFFREEMSRGRIVRTEDIEGDPGKLVPDEPPWAGVLRHEAVPFVSYPYEWTFGMLKDAALLHLELLRTAIAEDVIIKDGTAYNVQWNGARPVFIDVASFERLLPGRPWAGYRQFCQTFLYPLFLQAYKNVAFHSLLRGSLDGISPQTCANLMSVRDIFRSGVLSHVLLHARLEASPHVQKGNFNEALPRAGFDKSLIDRNAANLESTVRRLNWNPTGSKWSEYAECNSYSAADQARKAAFVRGVCAALEPRVVWDLGCNTGEDSRIVAEYAKYVIAIDSDHLAVERLYQSLKRPSSSTSAARILPLVMNLVDSSPNLGWRLKERKSLEERGRPDLTLCLALIHHLVIGAGVLLRDLLDWLVGLGGGLVIEFVGKQDPMVQQLLRNKRDNYADYEPELFERWLNERFVVTASERLESGTRTLYYAKARSAP